MAANAADKWQTGFYLKKQSNEMQYTTQSNLAIFRELLIFVALFFFQMGLHKLNML